jgi:hypothetical protein
VLLGLWFKWTTLITRPIRPLDNQIDLGFSVWRHFQQHFSHIVNPVHGEVYTIKHYVINLSVTCDRSVFFSGSSDFLHQQNWPPRYDWNIVESGVKHHNPNPLRNVIRLCNFHIRCTMLHRVHFAISGNPTTIRSRPCYSWYDIPEIVIHDRGF